MSRVSKAKGKKSSAPKRSPTVTINDRVQTNKGVKRSITEILDNNNNNDDDDDDDIQTNANAKRKATKSIGTVTIKLSDFVLLCARSIVLFRKGKKRRRQQMKRIHKKSTMSPNLYQRQ
jgi:hypothetical protein